MFERFSQQARAVVVRSQDEARALGHRFIGTEHLLLSMLDDEAGTTAEVLREAGVRAEDVRERILRLIAAEQHPLGERDAEALRSIGIDLDAVRAQVEQTFGPGALNSPTGPGPRRGWLVRRQSTKPRSGHIPFTRRAKKVLELSLREAIHLQHGAIGSEHILLGLIRDGDGIAVRVLRDSGLDLTELRRRVIARLSPST